MDVFGKKEKALKQEIETLKHDLKEVMEQFNEAHKRRLELSTENEKLKKELEHRDYIAQGIHNIMTYNGEPQKVG